MEVSLLQRFFPTPRLMTMQGGGIEISDRSLKYFRFDPVRGGVHSSVFGELLLPKGAIVGGEIADAPAVIKVLSEARAKGGFYFVHASLPEQKGYLFDLALPRNSAAPIMESIERALPEHVPLSPAEAVFDCEEVAAESDATVRSVVVTAFPEALAQTYNDVLVAAGFFPVSFELEPQAAARIVPLRDHPSNEAQLLVDFGIGKTVFSVVQNGTVRFTTSTEGSGALDAALAQKIGSDPSHTAADIENEVERLKREEGVLPNSPSVELFSKALSGLASSIARVRVYWQSRALSGERREQITSIVLYGGNANIRGLAEYLTGVAGIHCTLADMHFALGKDGVPSIPKDKAFRFATVLGLALHADTSIW